MVEYINLSFRSSREIYQYASIDRKKFKKMLTLSIFSDRFLRACGYAALSRNDRVKR